MGALGRTAAACMLGTAPQRASTRPPLALLPGHVQESLQLFQQATSANPHNLANLKQVGAQRSALSAQLQQSGLAQKLRAAGSGAGGQVAAPAGPPQGGSGGVPGGAGAGGGRLGCVAQQRPVPPAAQGRREVSLPGSLQATSGPEQPPRCAQLAARHAAGQVRLTPCAPPTPLQGGRVLQEGARAGGQRRLLPAAGPAARAAGAARRPPSSGYRGQPTWRMCMMMVQTAGTCLACRMASQPRSWAGAERRRAAAAGRLSGCCRDVRRGAGAQPRERRGADHHGPAVPQVGRRRRRRCCCCCWHRLRPWSTATTLRLWGLQRPAGPAALMPCPALPCPLLPAGRATTRRPSTS